MIGRAGCMLLGLLGLVLPGCYVDAPTYPVPSDSTSKHWALEPGFDPGVHQVARWICLGTLPSGDKLFVAPRVDLVLVNHPGRGLLLHELTTDRVMMPGKTIPGGGIEFISYANSPSNQETDRYTVPPNYQEDLTRRWSLHFAFSLFEYKQQQLCKPGPPVRFL